MVDKELTESINKMSSSRMHRLLPSKERLLYRDENFAERPTEVEFRQRTIKADVKILGKRYTQVNENGTTKRQAEEIMSNVIKGNKANPQYGKFEVIMEERDGKWYVYQRKIK
jgi:hypothetical protein